MSISATKSGTIRGRLSGGAGLELGIGTSIACAVNVSIAVVEEVMEAGLSAQEDFAGAPVQVSATAALKPFVEFTEMVTGAPTAPCATVNVLGEIESVKSGAVDPVPVSGTVCGLPLALSVTVKVPERGPVAVGVNVTLIVQFAFAASVAGLIGQALVPVLVWAKSPEAAIKLIVRGLVPVFVSVTVCGALVVVSA
jgi:hypothetical protein